MAFQDHFSTTAKAYAAARPDYPPVLFEYLAGLAPGRELAWDAGTGSGQAASALASLFRRVRATDPSTDQLSHALPHPRVDYAPGAEDDSGLRDGSTDLVIAAQAAHWFDLDRFYAEARRVLRPGGVIAIWCYGNCRVTPAIDAILVPFYDGTLAQDWPPERALIEAGYRTIPFPFTEVPFPRMDLEKHWTREEFLAYLDTWSAVTRYRKRTGDDPMPAFTRELESRWGTGRHMVRWPLNGRAGIA